MYSAVPGWHCSVWTPLSPVFCGHSLFLWSVSCSSFLVLLRVAGDTRTPTVLPAFTFLAMLPGRCPLVAIPSRTRRDRPLRVSGQGAPPGCVFAQGQPLSESFSLASSGRRGLLFGWEVSARALWGRVEQGVGAGVSPGALPHS